MRIGSPILIADRVSLIADRRRQRDPSSGDMRSAISDQREERAEP
jgi:hypothetical protein